MSQKQKGKRRDSGRRQRGTEEVRTQLDDSVRVHQTRDSGPRDYLSCSDPWWVCVRCSLEISLFVMLLAPSMCDVFCCRKKSQWKLSRKSRPSQHLLKSTARHRKLLTIWTQRWWQERLPIITLIPRPAALALHPGSSPTFQHREDPG